MAVVDILARILATKAEEVAAATSSALVARIRARMSATTMRNQPFPAPSYCVTATNASSLRFAVPEAIASRARSMPSPIDAATSAA